MKKFILISTLLFFNLENCYSQNSTVKSKDLKEIDIKKQQKKTIIKDELIEDLSLFEEKFKSLMFYEEELDKLKQAVESFKTGQSLEIAEEQENITEENSENEQNEKEKELSELNERSKIYLGSILYFSPNKWTIWLNDDKINSDNNNKDNEFFVNKIDGKNVNIIWTLSLSKWKILSGGNSENITQPKVNNKNQVKTSFTLGANQTFILKYNKVFEGKKDNKNKKIEKEK